MIPKRIKTNEQIAREAANADTGFCNPLKVKFASEARESAIDQIERRGWSRTEALQMIKEAA